VYKGVLGDGEEIAIKRLTKACRDERKEKEFLTEIGTIGHVCHPNVLSLLGCCTDNGLYLIFHFSSRGSVASLLHGTKYKLVLFVLSVINDVVSYCIWILLVLAMF